MSLGILKVFYGVLLFFVSLISRYLIVFIAIFNGILFFVTYLLIVMYLSHWEHFIPYFEKWIQNKNTELILFLLYKTKCSKTVGIIK